MYRVEESTGEQILCNSAGMPIKPFNPKITGKFDYEGRKRAIVKSKADLSPVELPV